MRTQRVILVDPVTQRPIDLRTGLPVAKAHWSISVLPRPQWSPGALVLAGFVLWFFYIFVEGAIHQ
jgi:hypothetical protein